jgi:hypothetical protein
MSSVEKYCGTLSSCRLCALEFAVDFAIAASCVLMRLRPYNANGLPSSGGCREVPKHALRG